MPRPHALLLTSLLIALPAQATITLDMSFVDTGGAAYARFKDYVDGALAAGALPYGFAALDAVLMARLDGDPAYCQLAVTLVEQQVDDAYQAMAAGQRPAVSGDSYLEAGEMISDLAFTWDTCALTASQRSRWHDYAEQTVWNIWHHETAHWDGVDDAESAWSGWSTDDPLNNYYYSFVEATMTWALASDSSSWQAFLANDRLPLLTAAFADLAGGGSPEGTAYGSSHMRLFWLYRLWRDATGNDLAAQNTHADDSILYWVHATVPTLDRFAPIGDQARVSIPELYDYQRRLVLEARALSHDATRRAIASGWLNAISVNPMQSSFNYRHDLLPAGSDDSVPAARYHHATGVGQLFARSDWSTDAWWLAVVAGPFAQSHAHEEQGGFTLFHRDWLTVTENIWSHSGIEQGTEVHNVLRFEHDGAIVPQRRDTVSTMTVEDQGAAGLAISAELTPAYGGNPAVLGWQRQLQFGADGLEITDDYQTGSGTVAVFQLQLPARPTISGTHAVAGDLAIDVLEPAGATLSAIDWSTVDADYDSGWRLDIGAGSGRYRVRLGSAGRVFGNGFEAIAPAR